MNIIDKISYGLETLQNNYIMERIIIDAGKDMVKGAAIGAGIALAINMIELRYNSLPKSMLKYIVK